MENLQKNLSAILENEEYKRGYFTNNIYLDDLFYWNREFQDLDEFEEYVQEIINEVELIYYSEAMEFLQENDISLQDSLEIAADFWYETDNLNSELLATLLLQQYIRNDFNEIIQDLKEEYNY